MNLTDGQFPVDPLEVGPHWPTVNGQFQLVTGIVIVNCTATIVC